MSVKVWTEPFSREIITDLEQDSAIRFRRHQLPESAEEWQKKRQLLLEKLRKKLKIDTDHELDLDCHYGVTESFGNYTVRQLYFQSVPGRYVTASLFIPEGKGPFPGVIMMHGHTRKGRLDEKNQKRAQVLVQSGYVTLLVDAFGSGDRTSIHGRYEYHGGMLGGMLLNIGEPLLGIQVVDNMRAVDLLCSLSIVNSGRIGATGSSGGGNQTMYLAAFDERIKAAVPVVSVGSYQSYIGGTNCICELIPDGLDICEESALLALAAPRAIMPCNGLHDINPTFHVPEMMRSYTEAMKVFKALGCPEKLCNMGFNGPHAYPIEVQAEMIKFFDLHLKETKSNCSVTDLENIDTSRKAAMLFKKGERAQEVSSIPEYIQNKAAELAQKASGTAAELTGLLHIIDENYTATRLSSEQGWEKYMIETDRRRVLPFLFKPGTGNYCRILAAPGGKPELETQELISKAEASGDSVLIFDPWGCGECGYIKEKLNIWIEQHQLSRALLWLGRRLMGEWVMDFLCAVKFAKQQLPHASLQLTGVRDSALAALYASIIKPEGIESLEMIDFPATLVRKAENKNPIKIPDFEYVPTEYFTMALAIPDILKWGDVDYAMKLAECQIKIVRPRRLNGLLKSNNN